MKYLITVVLISILGLSSAQDEKVSTTKFKTSAVCEDCKERIEKELNYTKGVIFAELNLDNKVVTVKYKTKFLNSELLKGIVSGVGYDAGDVPRDPKAFDALPKCCKSEGICSH